MKICWDNLEKLEYRFDRGEWQHKKWKANFYVYKNSCKNCGEHFLAQKNNKSDYCDISCSKSGKPRSLETKNKISDTQSDKKCSDKTKRKMSVAQSGEKNPNFGKKHSEKTKIRMSKNHADVSGENHPNWKGGISCEPYCDVWLDKDFKESIKERDGYQCLNPVCSNESNRFCIHHINYIKKDCKPFNLITLCNSCNVKANSDREWHQAWYSIIMYNRDYEWQK